MRWSFLPDLLRGFETSRGTVDSDLARPTEVGVLGPSNFRLVQEFQLRVEVSEGAAEPVAA